MKVQPTMRTRANQSCALTCDHFTCHSDYLTKCTITLIGSCQRISYLVTISNRQPHFGLFQLCQQCLICYFLSRKQEISPLVFFCTQSRTYFLPLDYHSMQRNLWCGKSHFKLFSRRILHHSQAALFSYLVTIKVVLLCPVVSSCTRSQPLTKSSQYLPYMV